MAGFPKLSHIHILAYKKKGRTPLMESTNDLETLAVLLAVPEINLNAVTQDDVSSQKKALMLC